MNPRYAFVALRAMHRCEYCRAPELIFNFSFEVEHIIPTSRDGADHEANWALACRSCNVRKGSHVSGLDPETESVTRLFHPRDDRWDDHFRFVSEAGQIEGLTPTGRATIIRLSMNDEAQVAARSQWVQLGLFP